MDIRTGVTMSSSSHEGTRNTMTGTVPLQFVQAEATAGWLVLGIAVTIFARINRASVSTGSRSIRSATPSRQTG